MKAKWSRIFGGFLVAGAISLPQAVHAACLTVDDVFAQMLGFTGIGGVWTMGFNVGVNEGHFGNCLLTDFVIQVTGRTGSFLDPFNELRPTPGWTFDAAADKWDAISPAHGIGAGERLQFSVQVGGSEPPSAVTITEVSTTTIPEPATLVLLGTGLLVLGGSGLIRRREKYFGIG